MAGIIRLATFWNGVVPATTKRVVGALCTNRPDDIRLVSGSEDHLSASTETSRRRQISPTSAFSRVFAGVLLNSQTDRIFILDCVLQSLRNTVTRSRGLFSAILPGFMRPLHAAVTSIRIHGNGREIHEWLDQNTDDSVCEQLSFEIGIDILILGAIPAVLCQRKPLALTAPDAP